MPMPPSSNNALSVLAFGAHPDDLEFGCGAILVKSVKEGARLHLCIASRGEAGSSGSPDEREAEARSAAEQLGAVIEFVAFGGDCHLVAGPEMAIRLARVIREQKPQVILAPTLEPNQHPDHVAMGSAVRDAARLARYGGLAELAELAPHAVAQLLHYAITPSAEPAGQTTIRMDVSPHVEEWERLMRCHASQLKTRRYIELQQSRARTWGLEAGVEYAQVLFAPDPWMVESLEALPSSVRLY